MITMSHVSKYMVAADQVHYSANPHSLKTYELLSKCPFLFETFLINLDNLTANFQITTTFLCKDK